jgi:hypothetical protein
MRTFSIVSDRLKLLNYLRQLILIDILEFGSNQLITVLYQNDEIIDYDFNEEYLKNIHYQNISFINMTIKKLLLLVAIELYPNKKFENLICYINRSVLGIHFKEAGILLGYNNAVRYYNWENTKIPSSDNQIKISSTFKFDIQEFKKSYWNI